MHIKQEFENGEILNAEHLNHIEDAIEEIYNILNAAPVLSYVTDIPGSNATSTPLVRDCTSPLYGS